MTNPWGLTPREVATIDSIIATGSQQGAADRLGKALPTIHGRMIAIKAKMGSTDHLSHFLAWDRWRRPKGDPS